jgi:NADPH:quinone reductase-like Zn-dependent oxidoreductase
VGEGAVVVREVDVAHRLATARGLLRRLEDRVAGERPAAEPGAAARMLPVVAPLAALLPGGGLRRGTTVAVTGAAGATSLMLALLAEASAAGAWAGVVGRPDLGPVAAAEAGVALERLALVPYPGADLMAVTAALLDGLDLVVVAGRLPHGSDRARLVARARQRGAVLLPLGPWPGADLELACGPGQWRGVGAGEGDVGRLSAREVRVQLCGRGVAPVGRDARLLLPGPASAPAVERDDTPIDRPIEDREAG